MRDTFKLYQSHIDLAHDYWKQIVSVGDHVIDATCGNGHDSLALARFQGKLIAMDIQEEAILQTQNLLSKELSTNEFNCIQFINQCHSTFPDFIHPESVKLVVYNLGYLPGGNKNNTTMTGSTLKSIGNAQSLIAPGGAISITCYPGHDEGSREEGAILEMLESWNPKEWSCCHHLWLNRKRSPSIIIIQKKIDR